MRRLRRPRSGDDGFTLIELVVALSVMAVLVAVVVPTFSMLRTGVRQAATLADLSSARTALTGYATDNNGLVPPSAAFNPGPAGSNLVSYGWQQSAETTSYRYLTNTDRTTWCVEMTNVTGAVFSISGKTPTQAGTCSMIGVANY